MPRYTVWIEEDQTPYEYGAYDNILEAEHALRAAELSFPNGAAWVQDEKGNVVPREKIASPDELDLFLDPPADDEEYISDPATLAADVQRECPHNWQMMGDGLFHCYYFCGVRPHKPNPGEVSD